MDVVQRILTNIFKDEETGCWMWQGKSNNKGYPYIRSGGKVLLPYRVLYEHAVGPIPEGFEMDHLCRTPMCVNPQHVEPVTHRENMRRSVGPMGINARKTHCKYGHPFDEVNTYVRLDGKGRDCVTCRAARDFSRFANHRGPYKKRAKP
jgi:hypothetical protein